ncbi:monooxygenase [Salmonella enterica subsp. enterica]|uniref:Monooxygenase n=1 Tax=Salmonella enterica I TaxID=59201 RepID=A0A379VJ86_SALET|nr:monooxygenase [Salmonella enterica subsp. enterica]
MTDKTIPFSVLDLAPIPEGSSAKEAFTHSLDLARLAEKRGYHRYWLAEHHNMTGIASARPRIDWLSGGQYHNITSWLRRRDAA